MKMLKEILAYLKRLDALATQAVVDYLELLADRLDRFTHGMRGEVACDAGTVRLIHLQRWIIDDPDDADTTISGLEQPEPGFFRAEDARLVVATPKLRLACQELLDLWELEMAAASVVIESQIWQETLMSVFGVAIKNIEKAMSDGK